MVSLEWQERGLCAQTDPEAFHPGKGGGGHAAKRVCMSCDVRAECLQWALSIDEFDGVLGGMGGRARHRLAMDLEAKGERPDLICAQCGTEPIKRNLTGVSSTYCTDCTKFRNALSRVRVDAIETGTPGTEPHRWQSKPRPTMARRSEGYGGAA